MAAAAPHRTKMSRSEVSLGNAGIRIAVEETVLLSEVTLANGGISIAAEATAHSADRARGRITEVVRFSSSVTQHLNTGRESVCRP